MSSTNKLETLSPEQEALMHQVREEWLARAFKNPALNKEKAKQSIEWIYERAKLDKPQIVFVSSPLGAQFAAHLIKQLVRASVLDSVLDSVRASVLDSVRTNVLDSVHDSVLASVLDSVRASVRTNVHASVHASVRANVHASFLASFLASVLDSVRTNVLDSVHDSVLASVLANVRTNVHASVSDSVRASVLANVRASVSDSVLASVLDSVRENLKIQYEYFAYIGWWDYGWLSFYDFFQRIGRLDPNPDFDQYLRAAQTGIYDLLALRGFAIVCEPPSKISRDERGRLSSIEGPCIEWSDGFKLWAINGVFFEFELWERVVQSKLSAKEVLALENMEQRMIALKFAGVDDTLAAMKAKLLDKSDRGNELYLVKQFFESSPEAYFLKYKCPSTGRVYLSGIDPEFAKGKKADECMAWKFKMSLPEYNEMRIES